MLPPMDLTPAPSCPPEGAHQRFADDASSCAGATGLRHCHDATHQDHEEAHLHTSSPKAAGEDVLLGPTVSERITSEGVNRALPPLIIPMSPAAPMRLASTGPSPRITPTPPATSATSATSASTAGRASSNPRYGAVFVGWPGRCGSGQARSREGVIGDVPE